MKKRVAVEFDLDTGEFGTPKATWSNEDVRKLVVGMIAGLVDWPFDRAGLAQMDKIRDAVTITVKDT